MTLQEIFDKEMQPFGGRLPNPLNQEDEEFFAGYRFHMKALVEQIRQRNPIFFRNVYLDFVGNPSFNARAFIVGAHEFIGINSGVSFPLGPYCSEVLSHPQVFPEIGEAVGDAPTPLMRETEMLLYVFGYKINYGPKFSWTPNMPRHGTRFRYATYLSVLAWDFLFAHELCHIVRCHIPYLAEMGFSCLQTSGANMLQEFEKTPQDKAALRRILEIDADCFAAHIQVAGILKNDLKLLERNALGANEDNLPPNWGWADVCRTWLRAVWLLMMANVVVDRSPSIRSNGTHPHADARMQLLFSEAWREWQRVIPDRNAYHAIGRTVMAEMAVLLRDGILPTPPARTRATYREEFERTAIELHGGLNKVMPRLSELMRNRMAQPAAG
jgi:hypothetical protein